MTEQQTSSSNANANAAGERCVCNEVLHTFERIFEVPPTVREHLSNSRIEFLKAIRAAIDHRIEHLSRTAPQGGSRIPVE
jgi:hypothetical protein